MFVDSHCHLNFPELVADLPAILQAMKLHRVDRALCISTMLETFDAVHSLAIHFDNLWATVGVHPDSETTDNQTPIIEPSIDDLLKRAALPKVVGIGETGLDYYRLNGRSIEEMHWQRERFRVHIRAAQICAKPLIVHTRSAKDDTLAILREEGENGSAKSVGGVFHCFTESLDVARAALDLGFYISFSGILTFKNAAELREIAAFVPLERTLIETDSPYLAPAPHRGKINNPSYVPFVAAKIAEIKQTSLENVAEITSRNFEKLFKL